MGKYIAEKPKVYELAREYGLSPQEMIDILTQAGLPYKGFNATVNENEDELLNIIQGTKDLGDQELSVNLIGMYFDVEKRKYHPVKVRLTKKQFDMLGGKTGLGHATVYNAMNDYRLVENTSGVTKNYVSTKKKFEKPTHFKRTPGGKIKE